MPDPPAAPRCMACNLTAGAMDLPGGRIHETTGWVVEHCIGPLGVGTLIVKPKRHVVHVADLTGDEATEIGPLLQRTTRLVTDLIGPDEVYVCLWSHAGARPGHIHWVVQPVTRTAVDEWGQHGPGLQVAMFDRGEQPNRDAVEAFAARARRALRALEPGAPRSPHPTTGTGRHTLS